uniref:BRCT domain-containing protein n=1 Tax=Leptocylindrus danicus TaxID=163516 RepID=A0A7S2PEG0_9STRA
MRVSLDPVPEPEESPSKSSDTSDEDSTASDAGPPLSKLITNKNLRTFSRIINRFDPSKHHFKRDVFNGIWERLKTQDVEGHQMWGYQRPKSGLNLDFTFHFATPDGQELFATELDLVLRVVEEIQQCCEEGRLRVGAVDTILSMKQNGRRQRKTRVDLNPIKKEKKKNKEKQAKRKIVIEQEVQAPETANTKKEKQAKEKVEIEEEDEVSEAGSEISEVDTEVLSEGQLLTKVSKSTIAKIINSASPDDFNFMRDIFCPVWDVLTRQGGRGKESVSRWSWLRNNNKVPSMLDAPDYVYAVPFSKGCKKGSIGVDFFFKEIEVLWKVISLIQEDSESADGQPLSLSSDIVEKIQTKREENMNGLQKRKRQLSARAEQSIAAANAEKKAKEAKKAREKAKKMSKPTVKDGKKEKESAKLVTKKNDSSNKKKPKTSWTPKKISKKTKKVAVVEEDDASASIADDDKSTFTSFSEYSSSSSEDTEVIADGQLLTQVSMERCSRYCNKMLGSSNTALTELQVIRMLFNPIWTILKSQGTGKPSKWQYVPQSYNKLLSPHIWAVPGNDTNYLKEKPLQDSGYFETQMEVLACVCEYLRHQGMLSEKAWQCILAASSQKNNSRSSRSRRASVSRGDEQPQQKENSSAKKSRKRKSSLESSSSKIKKKKAETTPTGKVPSAPKHKSVEKKKVVKAKSKPKATEEKKKVRTAHVVVREEPTYFGDADSESISTKSSNGAGILRRNHVSPSSMSGKTDTTSSGESSSLTSVSTNGRPSNFDSTKEQPFQRTKAVTASTRRGVLTGVTFLLVGVDDVGFGNNIRQIVLDLGGIIAESITAVQMPVFHEGKNSVFFVSHPSQRRTLKYIFAAALQIPMLHYNWVLEMRKRVQQGSSPDPFDEKLFESMRLPYGLSLSSRRFKLPPLFSLEKVKSSDRNYLEGLTLMVVLGNQHMEEDWGNILRAVGVTIVPISILGAEPTSPKLQKVDAILTDSILLPPLERTVPVQLKHALAACGGQLPVVDLLWAIQCIVNRKKLNWEDNKIDLHDVTKRQIYSVKRSDNTRFDIGDIVQLIENGRRANSFGRILSFETRRSPSAYQHGFGYTVHLEEIEDRGQNLVDGGRVRRELNVEVTSLVSHVVMMKGKDFRQIQSSYGEDVYVQKVMARKSTD